MFKIISKQRKKIVNFSTKKTKNPAKNKLKTAKKRLKISEKLKVLKLTRKIVKMILLFSENLKSFYFVLWNKVGKKLTKNSENITKTSKRKPKVVKN